MKGREKIENKETAKETKDTKAPEFLVVGKVLTTFGVRGQLKVMPMTDYPERIGEIKRLYCRLEDGSRLELHPVDVRVHSESVVLVKFKEFNAPETAAILRHCLLEIPREEKRKLKPGHYYYADLVGLAAVRPDGTSIGTVEDVFEAGNALLSIKTPSGKEVLVPWVDEFVKKIDLEAKTVCIEPIPGLLEE